MTTVTMVMIEMIGWLTFDVTKEANLSSFTLCWCLHSWFSLLTWLQGAGAWISVKTMLTGLQPFLFALCPCTRLSQTGHDNTSWGTVEATFSCWGSWCEMWAEHEQMVCDRESCAAELSAWLQLASLTTAEALCSFTAVQQWSFKTLCGTWLSSLLAPFRR